MKKKFFMLSVIVSFLFLVNSCALFWLDGTITVTATDLDYLAGFSYPTTKISFIAYDSLYSEIDRTDIINSSGVSETFAIGYPVAYTFT